MAVDIPVWYSIIPWATLLIMLVSVSISLMNVGLNRLVISRMIGWHEYKSMQKELKEYNSLRMKATRAKDTKLLEKLKRKDAQMKTMQMKMTKPQLLMMSMMVVYFIIWPVMLGYFPNTVVYVPGFGEQPFWIWYFMCSLFFGTLTSKVVGLTPLD